MEKSAWVTGVLNYLTWGLGYLYSGQKTSYGVVWLVILVLLHIPVLTEGISHLLRFPGYYGFLGHQLISALLAYDGYTLVASAKVR